MQIDSGARAEILPEASIRTLALDGGNLVPKKGVDTEIQSASLRLQKLVANLLLTITHVDISGGHKTAACNLLCTVMSQCAQSQLDVFHSLLWDNLMWVDASEIFLTQHHTLSVKPLRALLTCLTTVLDKCRNPSVLRSTKDDTINKLVAIICSTTEHVPVRPAMQALANFLIKNTISAGQVYEAICSIRGLAPEGDRQAQHRTLMETTLRWAPYDDYSSSAGLLAAAILENISKNEPSKASKTPVTFNVRREVSWAEPILKVLAANPFCLEYYRHYVFPDLFKHDLQDFVVFLERLDVHRVLGNASQDMDGNSMFSQDELENILFCALSIGSKTGLVQVAESGRKTRSDTLFLTQSALCIPDTLLGHLILRSSATVRIAGLSMLIVSNTTTKPLSISAIAALRSSLPYLHADADAGFRSEMFSLIRILADRLRGATSNLHKLSTRHGTIRSKATAIAHSEVISQDAATLLEAHRAFLAWYVSFLKMELRPSASYQRHISAIKCVLLVYKSGVDSRIPLDQRVKTVSPTASWPFSLDVIDETMTDLLLDLLLDPFDDVRQGAAEILSVAPAPGTPSGRGHDGSHRLVNVLNNAEHTMMLTGRADHADGVAHLYNTIFNRCATTQSSDAEWWMSKYGVLEHLVEKLEGTLKIAAQDITRAVSRHPLHGLFISLRYIMDTPGFYKAMASSMFAALHLRLYACFHSVWSCVKATLCNDAPEGYVPDEMDDEDDVGTKDILSYSWRALKEASLLMRSVVKSCPVSNSDNALMTTEQLRDLGDLSFTQLAELRHRGAFSTVSQTFATCCVRCNSGSEASSGILQEWYQKAILCIQNQTTINTRRSAGIPSLMVGIVIADVNKGNLYQKAMQDLAIEATKPVDESVEQAGGLSQVHAMNCMKDMFRNSKLGERSEAHVPEALGLAANCLSSESWAIRNSGLMLFRSLLDRLLGTNESFASQDTAPQSRLSFTAVPNLMDVIFRLISPPLDTTKDLLTEGVFPALQLLQRTPPPASQLQRVQQAVLRLTASSQWHIRDKAAGTYAILIHHSDRITEATRLIKSTSSSLNAVHGLLLSSRYILQNSWSTTTFEDLTNIFSALHQAAEAVYHESNCPFTKAAFVDIYSDWCRAAYHRGYVPDDMDRGTPLSAPAEIDTLLDLDHDNFAAQSALRQSLAHVTLQESAYLQSIDWAEAESLPALVKLAFSDDADACATTLVEAAKLCISSEKFRTLSGELLTRLSAKLLFASDKTVDLEVQAAAQDVLVALLNSQVGDAVQVALRQEAPGLYLPINAATPLFQDKRLVLQGALLELRFCKAEADDCSLSNDFEDWVRSIRSALHENNPFDTRLAAAQALNRIRQGLKQVFTSTEYSASSLAFCLAAYDLTNDDDDEVRNFAASTSCNVLQSIKPSTATADLIPIPAGSKLAEFLAQRFNADEALASTSLSRLTRGAVTEKNVRAVKDIIIESGRQDTALFVQEKQNLFIDDAREMRLWSHVLMQISPKAFSQQLVHTLSDWTMDGLDTLLSTLDTRSDGPLGWKRRPEVFVLGLQLIYAAEVLLVLYGKARELVSVAGSDIRRKLVQLLIEGEKNEMHPLWLEQIERVLGRSIVRGVTRAGFVVSTASAKLEI